MPALDTNVLVRYIVQDDAAQLAAAKRLIGRCVAEDSTLSLLNSSGCCGRASSSARTTC
jgi:predicted nucleic acid-binding protein